jgi:hypothetical protein
MVACGIWTLFQYLSLHYSNDDVSLKLVYVGWDFGDRHYDDYGVILDL